MELFRRKFITEKAEDFYLELLVVEAIAMK